VPETFTVGLPKLELMVAVRLFAPELCGVNKILKEHVPDAESTWLAAQVLPVIEKSALSDRLIGVAPRVTAAPLAVRVTAPQETEVPTPVVAPQFNVPLAVRDAAVPEREPDPTVPSWGVTVNVSEIDPVVAGVKLETVTRLQLLPEVSTCPVVQAPELGVLVMNALVLPLVL
jgi:hypothetical protein